MPNTGISHTNLGDLWKTTLENLPWDGSFEYVLGRHHFEVMDQWLRDANTDKSPGGTQIRRKVIYQDNGSAVWVRPAQVMTPEMIDCMADITGPFVGIRAHHSVTDTEIKENAGPAKLIDLAKTKRAPAHLSLATEMEDRAWQSPDDSSDDLHPRGIPYAITPILASQATGGHNGGNPYYGDATQAADCAGLSSAVYTRWKNYNDRWTNSSANITEVDAKRVGKMFRRLHWQAPKFARDLATPQYDKMRVYACEVVVDNWAEFVRGQNDNLGADGARYYGAGISDVGAPLVNGFPIRWIEYLDNDTTYPMYMVNHGYFRVVIDRDSFLIETGPFNDRYQPDTWTYYYDLRFQYFPTNRQLAGGVISYVAYTG